MAGGLVAGGAAAEAASSQAKPVEKTEQNIVSEKGMPSQEINLQIGLNQLAEKDTTVKKLTDLIGPDSTFINKALADKWMNYFDNDEARVVRLFSIFYELKGRQDEALKNLANKRVEDDSAEEEVAVRRKRGATKKSDEDLFRQAQDELYAREANEASQKSMTPEEQKQEEIISTQADKESAQEIVKNKIEKARENLPITLWDAFADKSLMKMLGIDQDAFDKFFAYITKELKKIKDGGRTASVNDLKKITESASNKFPGLGNLFSTAKPEQLKTAASIFGAANYVK